MVTGLWYTQGMAKCSISSCHEPVYAKTFCSSHYKRNLHYGDPLHISRSYQMSDEQYFEYATEEQPNGCIYWTKSVGLNGYGRASRDGVEIGAHRWVYQKHHGPIPDGQDVCHTCDNRQCVNSEHLYTGTRSDNLRDVAIRERRPNLKLTNDQVRVIRSRISGGEKQRDLAHEYGVAETTISAIKHRRARVHI